MRTQVCKSSALCIMHWTQRVSLPLSISLVLYMDVMPLGGKFITTFVVAIVASFAIKFLVVPFQRRRIQSTRTSPPTHTHINTRT